MSDIDKTAQKKDVCKKENIFNLYVQLLEVYGKNCLEMAIFVT